MKTVVLLAVVLALVVPAFGASVDPNELAVLVYKVQANVKAYQFTDSASTDAEAAGGKLNGYVVARVYKETLETYTDGDPNNDPIFIGVDSSVKQYTVISETDDTVEVGLAEHDQPIFNSNKNGAETNKNYVWAWVYVDADDDGLTLDVWDGVAQIKSTVIDNSQTKIDVPASIKFGNAEFYDDDQFLYGYDVKASLSLDSKYTKSANGSSPQLKVKGAAALIIADLVGKDYDLVEPVDFISND